MSQPLPRPAGAVGRSPHGRRRRARRLALGGLVVLAVLAIAGALAALRYLPALDDARALRADLESAYTTARSAGMEADSSSLDAIGADLASARGHLDRLSRLLASDPLVGLARAFPPTSADVREADAIASAGSDAMTAAQDGLGIARKYVALRDARAATAGTAGAAGTAGIAAAAAAGVAGVAQGSVLEEGGNLLVDSRTALADAARSLDHAGQTLATAPHGSIGAISGIRDELSARLGELQPVIDGAATISRQLPAILGFDGERRYLVLTQDPAEMRATGGFVGSFGIVALDHGRIVERTFTDTSIDFPFDYPWVAPPQALRDYLLGPDQPWQFSDANWSPDFRTSARNAMRLYTNETGDARLDGVVAITTDTIDELLTVTGPVAVPEFGVTVNAGETVMKSLQLTRAARTPDENRKAFLSAFADRLFSALLSLPPGRWPALANLADTFGSERLLQAWFTDPAAEALADETGVDGGVRQDAGDYVFPVDSNVAPVSKLNVVTVRSLQLDVQVDDVGNARDTLTATWDNRYDDAFAGWYRDMGGTGSTTLGMYFRVLTPARTRPVVEPGTATMSLAEVGDEAGRAVMGTYLRVPPGSASVRLSWVSPYAADPEQGVYRLTIQRQPGLLDGALDVMIHAPPGCVITAATPGLAVSGDTAVLHTTFERDVVLGIRYQSESARP